MSENIPPEAVRNILTRLPVKSLLRFRCVCKPWVALIDSPSFVNSHLARNISTKSNTCLVTRDRKFHAHSVASDLADRYTSVNFSHTKKFVDAEIVGSVNGIVCLFFDTDNSVVLWNPSTRKHFKLPKLESSRQSLVSYGLGYDSASDDFKVVRVYKDISIARFSLGKSMYSYDIKVFSMRSGAWTQKEDIINLVRNDGTSGRFAKGALHWLMSPNVSYSHRPHDNLIIAFDLATEEYQRFPQPDYPQKLFLVRLVVFQDSLALVCNYNLGYIDIWVMKEYGVKESWTRFISVDPCRAAWPVAYSMDGTQVLLEKNCERLVWFDMEWKSFKESGIRGKPMFSAACMLYVESLVQLPCPTKVGKNDVRRMKMKKTKKRDGDLVRRFESVL